MTYIDKMKGPQKLYVVGTCPLDLNSISRNHRNWGDYGYGLYMFDNSEYAILDAVHLTRDDQEMDKTYSLYEVSFGINPLVDYSKFTNLHWMYRWFFDNGNPTTIPYEKGNWDCYSHLWKEFIFAHNKFDDLIKQQPCIDCGMAVGPVVDIKLLSYLHGNDMSTAIQHYDKISELSNDIAVEYCFKSDESLKLLNNVREIGSWEGGIAMNKYIGELRHEVYCN